tara:strand:- start:263 stop:445 length:183 start_codon:yes stop_codon:yes gene_type:complete
MNRIEELKEIIRLNEHPAEWGHGQARINLINAEEELAQIEAERKNQAEITFPLPNEEKSS